VLAGRPGGSRGTVHGLLLTACVLMPADAPVAPELQLVAAGQLALPGGCEPSPGSVYRVSYVVEPARSRRGRRLGLGRRMRTGRIAALGRIVSVCPLGRTLPATIDWIAVTAARGG